MIRALTPPGWEGRASLEVTAQGGPGRAFTQQSQRCRRSGSHGRLEGRGLGSSQRVAEELASSERAPSGRPPRTRRRLHAEAASRPGELAPEASCHVNLNQ